MNLPKNAKLWFGIAVTTIVLILIALWYRRRTQSKYTYADIKSGPNPPETTTYSNIIQCQVTYNTGNLTATTQTQRDELRTRFDNCVRSNVGLYVDTKCRWVTSDPTASDTNEYAAFGQFSNDQIAIQTAYMDLLARSDTSTTPRLDVVEAALKADLTGATRRYLATVCPDYFKTPTNNPTSTYLTWTTTATAPAASTYAFYAGATGKITAAMVNTWAAKAAQYTTNDITTGAEPFTVDAPYVSTGSTYNANSTISNPAGGFYKNWEIAKDNGPGTNNPQA